MRFLVLVRWQDQKGHWHSVSYEQGDEKLARELAERLYADNDKDVCVILYELKQSWN